MAPLFSVIGGRLIQQPGGGGFPLNGQQLQLQVFFSFSDQIK
jgi:hypothetical protein